MAFGKLSKFTPYVEGSAAVVDPTQVVAVDPFAPAIQPIGSANFIQPINTPAPKPEEPWKPSALGILDRVLGGMTITEARQAAQADHDAELLKPQVQELTKLKLALQKQQLQGASSLAPGELSALLNNPTEYGKAMASRLEAATVPAGSTRVFGDPQAGGHAYFAPKVDAEGGIAYSISPDGTKIIGATPYVPKMEKLGPGDVAKAPPVFFGSKLISTPDQPASDAPPATGPSAPPSGPIYSQIADIATKAGASPGEAAYLQHLAQVESSGDPNARNGSSTGLFQFHPDTFTGAGGKNIGDVADQTQIALKTSRQYRAALQQMGVEPSDANAYIMHQQGPGGAQALFMANPNANAIDVLTPIYKGDRDMAHAAIVGNGGKADTTAGQFLDMWRKKWGGSSPAAAPAPAATGAGDAPGTLYGGPAKADDDIPLTKDAVDLLAGKFLSTGVLPPMGMGKSATANRNAVMNRATEMAKDLGLSADDLVAGNASIKALGQSLNKITTQKYAVAQLEETAKRNADLVLELAPKGAGPTNIPVLNRWLQAGRKQIAGDADVTKFDNALSAFSEEYAKVMSGSLGNQAATDSARAAAADRLGKYATQNQLAQGIAVMKTEMQNRMAALDEVESGIRRRIRAGGRDDTAPGDGGGASGPAGAPQAKARRSIQGATDAQNAWITQNWPMSGPLGSQTHPWVPRSEKEFEGLKVGQWFINPADGQVLQKTH